MEDVTLAGIDLGKHVFQSQQTLSALHRVRESLVRDRVRSTNQIHGFLLEFGVSLPKGQAVIKRLPALLAEHALPPRLGTDASYRTPPGYWPSVWPQVVPPISSPFGSGGHRQDPAPQILARSTAVLSSPRARPNSESRRDPRKVYKRSLQVIEC